MAQGKRAVVIGGSIAGLVAAGALARHFERVTLVERDDYPDAPAPRKGTPQARHVHVLLKQGEAAIESLFPGLFAELVERGGQRVDTAGDARWHYYGGWKARFKSGIEMVILFTDFLGHNVMKSFREAARAQGLPVLCCRRSTCSVKQALADGRFGAACESCNLRRA